VTRWTRLLTVTGREVRAFAPACGLIGCVLLDIWSLGIGDEVDEATNIGLMSLSIAEQPFGDDAALESEQRNLDVPLGG
jgi:hypothetical protein